MKLVGNLANVMFVENNTIELEMVKWENVKTLRIFNNVRKVD